MNNELYLKTAFCCMACDGDIATEEIQLVKDFISKTDYFVGLDVETLLNSYIDAINKSGLAFLNSFLKDVKNEEKTSEEELNIIKIAIGIIEADNVIQYSEVKFFKNIRNRLKITDEEILAALPDKEDYLLPDNIQQEFEFVMDGDFNAIKIEE